MNKLASELNDILEGTACGRLLSDFGRRIYFPKGILSQTAEANKQAHRQNATVGMAFIDRTPMELPLMRKQLPGLEPSQAVAYAPSSGDPALRERWKQEILRKNPGINPDEISLPLTVSGLTNGISLIADMFLDEGDDVVVPDMFWGNYRLIFEERRLASLKTFPFFSEEGELNIQGFRKTLEEAGKRGKVVAILNFPNNPTGYSPTKDEAKKLVEEVNSVAEQGIDILIISDDAYFGLFFEQDTEKESIFSPLSNLHPRVLAVKIDGATKEDFLWGFRIGFVTFGGKGMSRKQYIALEKKLTGSLRSSLSSCSRPAQSLLLKGLGSPGYLKEKEQYNKEIERRYLKVREILRVSDTPQRLEPLPFNSGYFMSFRCNGINAETLRLKLLGKGIGTIAIQEKYLRVAFSAVDLEDIPGLFDTIYETADEL
ncbi:MAG: aminotransferase class I/II-fold pyridoxal phosphate-dependent enzyme [Spirochaetales bacterium]|nr:aminotransferase class I/II-fold pyridoxal phosphate-dependent enzyme [Spirochaetales bacterium]